MDQGALPVKELEEEAAGSRVLCGPETRRLGEV